MESLIGEWREKDEASQWFCLLSAALRTGLLCPPPGENPLPPDDPNKELMGKTEVSLTLTNKFDVPGEANAEMDAKTLLLKYVQPVDSLVGGTSFVSTDKNIVCL